MTLADGGERRDEDRQLLANEINCSENNKALKVKHEQDAKMF